MALVLTGLSGNSLPEKMSIGNKKMVRGKIAFDSSYPTGGEPFTPNNMGLSIVENFFVVSNEGGYAFDYDYSNQKLKVFDVSGGALSGSIAAEAAHTHAVALDGGVSDATSGGTPAGTNASSAVTGTGTFVGTAPTGDLNLAVPAFSGIGLTAAGQVMTTTDNQTMAVNECSGMWLLAATGATPPMLIMSNTEVTVAPAVLTVIGAAATDAGAYRIVKALIPVGSVTALSGTAAGQTFSGSALATHTHGPGSLADAASGVGSSHTHTATLSGVSALVEVPNATNLSSLNAVEYVAIGSD